MKIYVVNYVQKHLRYGIPSGVVVIHPTTNILIARGDTPLSQLLVKHYVEGVTVAETDRFSRLNSVKNKPRHFASFADILPKWLTSVNMRCWVGDIPGCLPEKVNVAWDLSITDKEEATHERISLVEGNK
jgi:hypothetical protein